MSQVCRKDSAAQRGLNFGAVVVGVPDSDLGETLHPAVPGLQPRGRAAGADPALLAHHAEGAGDAQAVLRHAPEAARRSAALGAHREAAAQYERSLRNAKRPMSGRLRSSTRAWPPGPP